jgi:putative ABC transport system permease protein
VTAAIHLGLEEVAATLALVAVAVAVAGGGAPTGDSILWVALLLAVMVVFGALTAGARARSIPHSFWVLLFALAIAASATLALVLGVFPVKARYLVPVGGMVIGNAMTASAVALNRLGDEIHDAAGRIEATLALGATGTQAIRPIARRSLRSGMIPLIDSTKTTGLTFFPGTMVGMLLAGASPTDAVRLQLVLLYVLLGAVALSTLLAVLLSRRAFSTAEHQLREPPGT